MCDAVFFFSFNLFFYIYLFYFEVDSSSFIKNLAKQIPSPIFFYGPINWNPLCDPLYGTVPILKSFFLVTVTHMYKM